VYSETSDHGAEILVGAAGGGIQAVVESQSVVGTHAVVGSHSVAVDVVVVG